LFYDKKDYSFFGFSALIVSSHQARSSSGIDMSGRRPLIKGYFAVLRLIVDAVMSSACLMRVMTPVGPDVVR
jgi:hypothetical protein